MSNFWNLFGKGQSKKDRKSSALSNESQETFILEPILTPSGLVDGSDDSSDVALADIDIEDASLEEIEIEAIEDIVDTAEAEAIEELEEIPFVEDTETIPGIEVSDGEFEEIEFINDLESSAENENISNLDDLINSNVVDNNETELITTNIEELPEATEKTEVETGTVNNDEISANSETEVTETDEVLDAENLADNGEESEVEAEDANNDEIIADSETEVIETDEALETENLADAGDNSEAETEAVNNDEIIANSDNGEESEAEVEAANNGEIIADSETEVIETDEVLETENLADNGDNSEAETEAVNNDEIIADSETEVIETDEVLETENLADNGDNSEAEAVDNDEITANLDLEEDSSTSQENSFGEELEEIATASPVKFDSGTFTVASEGKVGIDFLADGGGYQGEIAIFSLEGMEEFEAGSPEFIKEAARRSLSDSELGHVVIDDKLEGARFSGKWPHEGDFNRGEYLGVKTFEMRPGDTFGVMLVPKGSANKVFDNPGIGGGNRPLFSMTTANPDDGFHVGQIADFDGEGNTFVMEDLRMDGNSDRDYNDVVFQVRGAKGNAVGLDEVMNVDKDWRDSDIGRGLVAYTEPYVVEETTVEEVVSETGGESWESLFDNPVEMGEGVVEVDELLAEVPGEEVAVEEVEATDSAETEPTATTEEVEVVDEPVVEPKVELEPAAKVEEAEVENNVVLEGEAEETEVENTVVEGEPEAKVEEPDVEEPQVQDEAVAIADEPEVEPEPGVVDELEPAAKVEEAEVEETVAVELEPEVEVEPKAKVEETAEAETEKSPKAKAEEPKAEKETVDPEAKVDENASVEESPEVKADEKALVGESPEVKVDEAIDENLVLEESEAEAEEPKVQKTQPEVKVDFSEVEKETAETETVEVKELSKAEVDENALLEKLSEAEVDETAEVKSSLKAKVDETLDMEESPKVKVDETVDVETEPEAKVDQPKVETETVEVETADVETEPEAEVEKPKVEKETVEAEVDEVKRSPKAEVDQTTDVEELEEVKVDSPEVEEEVVEVETAAVETEPEVKVEEAIAETVVVETPGIDEPSEVDGDSKEVDAKAEKPIAEPDRVELISDEPKKDELSEAVETDLKKTYSKPEETPEPKSSQLEPEPEKLTKDELTKDEIGDRTSDQPKSEDIEKQMNSEGTNAEAEDTERQTNIELVATADSRFVEVEDVPPVEPEPVATVDSREVEPETEVEDEPEVEPEAKVEDELEPTAKVEELEVDVEPEVEETAVVKIELEVEKPEVEVEVEQEQKVKIDSSEVEPEPKAKKVEKETVKVETVEVEESPEAKVNEAIAETDKPKSEEPEKPTVSEPKSEETEEPEKRTSDEPEVELEVEDESVATADEPEVEPEPEVEDEPVATADEPEVEPEVEPEPVAATDEPEVEPETEVEDEPEVEPEVVDELEPAAKVEETVVVKIEPEVEEPEIEVEVEQEQKAKIDSSEVEPEPKAKKVEKESVKVETVEVEESPETKVEETTEVESSPEVKVDEAIAETDKPKSEEPEKPTVSEPKSEEPEKPTVSEPKSEKPEPEKLKSDELEDELQPEKPKSGEVEPEKPSSSEPKSDKLEPEKPKSGEPKSEETDEPTSSEQTVKEPKSDETPDESAGTIADETPDETPEEPAGAIASSKEETPTEPKPLPKPPVEPKEKQPLVGVIGTGFNANNPDLNYDNITLGSDRADNDDNPLLQKGEGNEQGTHVLGIIAATNDNDTSIDGVNDKAPVWVGRADTSNWAESLIEFVDAAKESAQPNAVVNLSLNNLSQNELTFAETTAIQYARENNVIVVVPAGNHPEQMSAVAKAAKEFNNIVTVGASDGNNRAFYSATGVGLTLVADGGTPSNPVVSTVGETTGKLIGAPVAAAKVTGTVSKVWAGNPDLNYTQVIEVLKNTATDIDTPNWDADTGAGVVNTDAAVYLGKTVEAESLAVESFAAVEETVKHLSPDAPEVANPIAPLTLTPEANTRTVQITNVFAAEQPIVKYELVSGDSDYAEVSLEGNTLEITALLKTGETAVAVRAIAEDGSMATHTFEVTTNYISKESVAALDNALGGLQEAISNNPDDLFAALDTEEAATAFEELGTQLEQNFDNILEAVQKPETLAKAGVSPAAVETLTQLLDNDQLGEALGLPGSVSDTLNDTDFTAWDNYLINANEAASLLTDDAVTPPVAFLDFAGEHGDNVTDVFESVNPDANYDTLSVDSAEWGTQLINYVNQLKESGEERGIVNLSFDLTQVDAEGRTTTRYELTETEQLALKYARDNNVLLVVASGNTGGEMSALGQAAEKFDNIITVGAVNKLEETADYSSRGETLTLVAPGGQYENDPDAFVGTSRATSYVTGAASLVWAANPELSYQQVKEILTSTARDLGPEGWDADTGAGLLDVAEAVMMAGLVMPQDLVDVGSIDIDAFAGEGRVSAEVRAASPETERAIAQLTDTQSRLNNQWQVLRDLGNPDLTLEELQAEIAKRKSSALDSYQDADVAAAKSLVETQQLSDALMLAMGHHQIELGRLQALEGRLQQLTDGLAALTGERDELVAANEEQLQALEEALARTEKELDTARAKLQYRLVETDTLIADADAVKAEIAKLEAKIREYRQESAAFKAQADSYYAQAVPYRQQQQHHTNIANNHSWIYKHPWGRFFRFRNVAKYNHHIHLAHQAGRTANSYSWQGDAFQVNHHQLEQLIAQMEQQTLALKEYDKLVENNDRKFSQLTGKSDDAHEVLEALQEQAAEKTKLAEQYWQQAAFAEERRKRSQDMANWHRSMMNRWEVVGYRRTRSFSWNRDPIYGWRHYPEHVAPHARAREQAHNAEVERQTFEQWARQAQAEADALNQQATALAEGVEDWPELKRGIEYEINAKQQQLQGEKDLVALQTPVQKQQLETLELQISQSEAELQKLETEELPGQQQKTDATEERLQKTQEKVEANRSDRSQTTKDLQNFLETYGYLLPYQERRAAVQKQIKQLEVEKARVQDLLVEIGDAVDNNPDSNLAAQLQPAENYLNDIQQQLAYAKVQEEQLNLSAPDSPQRLAIGNLIADLEKRQQNSLDTNTLPLQEYIDFLRGVENRSTNLLNGFDDLEERLTAAVAEQTAADETLKRLQGEYRDLGLEKADIKAEKAVVEQKIALKDTQIADTKTAIAQTKNTIKTLENELAATKQAESDKEAEIVGQEGAIAPTQTDIATAEANITAKQAEITQQQSVLQGYNDQIQQANAVANNFEQERQQHQNSANYWNSQINTWGVTGYERDKSGKPKPIYGWVYNPQAEANRDAAIAAANNAAKQRDLAAQQATQLAATLQPQINAAQTELARLQTDKQNLEAEKQNLQTKLSGQQQELQNLHSEKTAIAPKIAALEADIATNETKVDELDAQLLTQNQERVYLQDALKEIDDRIADKEAEIADKYREIELTEKYALHVSAESDRLSNRIQLLNEADDFETEYRAQEDKWEDAIATQVTATNELLATRKEGEDERKQLLSLQTELADAQTELAAAKEERETREAEVEDIQKELEFAKLQLENQRLQLESLIDQDEPLRSAEARYYGYAQYHRARMWYWNGHHLTHHRGHAAAYRERLQQASRFAQQRNENSQKRLQTEEKIEELQGAIASKQTDLATKQSELAAATPKVANLTATVGEIEGAIAPLATGLKPLQQQEAAKLQEFQTAVEAAETIAQQLATTTDNQADALNRLISFGVLGTESDVDFFATQVEAKVEGFIEELENRSGELAAEADKLTDLIAGWQEDLAKTTDEVSRQALADLIAKTTAGRDNLLARKGENEEVVKELSDRLTEAINALTPLRQQQELEIREQLNGNDDRLDALHRQLQVEEAAENALSADTVLAYAELNDRVRADLTASATQWVTQLQEGHQQTKEIGESQQNLSQSVDDLIEYIEDNLGEVDGERDRNLANLRDAITTLGVVAPRRDELAEGETTLKQEIDKLKQWIELDAKLWEEIESIADRYTLRDIKAALDDNLIRNGSFEDVEGVTGITRGIGALPAGWINVSSYWNGADTYSEDGSFGLQGNAYGNFQNPQAQEGSKWVAGNSEYYEQFAQKLETPLEPGKTYDLSAYLKRTIHSNHTDPSGYEVYLTDSTGLKSKIPLGTLEPTENRSEWERRSFSFVAPEAAKTHPYIVFRPISLQGGISYTGIDNVSLTVATYDEAEEKALPIAKSLAANGTDNPADSEKLQELKQHLQEYDRLKAQQKEVAADAAEIRDKWEGDVNFDPDKIVRVEFDNKLVESVRNNDSMTYNRYSTDGGKSWSNWQKNVMHSKEDDIKLVAVDGKLYQAVRHLNNIVYLRHSIDGHSWTPWNRVTNEVAGNFEVAAIANNLVLSVRAATNPADNKIYTTNSNVSGDRWSSSEPTPVPSLNDFSLENIEGKLVQSYLGTDNRKYTRQTEDGINWTQWEVDDAPEVEAPEPENTVSIQFGDKTFQTTTAPDRRMYQRHSIDGGKTWTEWKHTGGIANEVKLVTLNDKLFQVVKGTDNKTYIRHSTDGENWTNWNNITWATTGELEIDAVGDRLLVSVRSNKHEIWSRHALDGTQWSGAIQATPQTMTDMLQEVVDGKLLQSYRDMDNQIYTRHSSDGVNWSEWESVEDAIAVGDWRQQYLETLPDSPIHQLEPTRIEYDNQLIEAVRGPNNYLYGRTSIDGGETWSDWSYAHGQVKEKPKMLEFNGKLYQFGRTANDIVHLRYSTDGKTWTPWRRITNEILGNYEVAAIADNLVLSVRALSDNKIYTTNSQFQVDRWPSGVDAPVPSLDDFTLETIDGKLVQSYLGVDNNIYTRESTDGIGWTEWESRDLEAKDLETRKEGQLKPIVDRASEILLPSLLHVDGEKSMTIEGAIGETREEAQKYGKRLALLKEEEEQNNAQASAAIVQADWYEKRAAYHWHRSRKGGPTWTEQRLTWKRKWYGRKKKHWVTVTHVDHDWIIWDTYTKYAQQLRNQAVYRLVAAENQSQEQERLQPLAEQWVNAHNAANAAEPSVTASGNLVEVLEATREEVPTAREQLQLLEELLPDIEELLAEAQKEADDYNAKVLAEWEEHDEKAAEYLASIEDILERRGELNKQSQELQNKLADTEKWVERQTVALGVETEQVDKLREQLIGDGEDLAAQIATATGSDLTELQTKQAQLKDALALLDNKAAVLRQQQAAFSQKRTLLTAENEVILAEQRLLDAYLTTPEDDFEELQQQLADARAAVAEAQRLAEQAEASSKALTAPLQEVQNDLLAQNDEHLQTAKEYQQILKDLLEATELNANYTLEAAQKQQEVNDLEFQILQRLQEVTAAGSQEAKHLLDVATHNDMATAAEIYYRDYSDLASDKGSSSAGGLARPEDRILADRYYQEMLNNRQLQHRAQAQANHFRQIKDTAQRQMNALSRQQETAAQMLQEINNKIAETQEQREAKEQELAVAQARLDGIARIRQQTEQTFVQLVSLEKLNLAQAQLEQQIAAQRQSEIEEEVARRIEREQIEIERQRLEARAKLEQLEQLQAEEDLRQAVNQARADVGLDEVGGGSDPVQLQSQMAALLAGLQDLEKRQPDLPEDVKALLADARGDIHLALQGKEAENIQQNLLKTTAGLVGQIQHYQTEIARIDLEEQWDTQLLAKAQQDLQGASRELVEELQRSEALSGERDIINPLYIETLSKVAYANQAVDISKELAKESREILERIVGQRVQERKARKKAFWNELLGTVSMVLGLISGVLLLFPPTAAIGGIAIAKVGLALSLVSGALGAVQSAINGDWLGAIFNGIMSAASFVSGGLSQALKAVQNTALQVWGMAQAVAKKVMYSIKAFQSLASGAFSGVRNALSGDSLMGFLQIMGGLAGAATSGINGFVQGGVQGLSDLGKFGYKVLDSLSKAPTLIYSGIKAIESGDLVGGIGKVVKGIVSLTKTWTNDFVDGEDSLGEKVANALENISSVGIGVSKFITGGLDGLLDGLSDIIAGWGDDISKWLEEHYKNVCECKLSNEQKPDSEDGENAILTDEETNESMRLQLEQNLGVKIKSAILTNISGFSDFPATKILVIETEDGHTYTYIGDDEGYFSRNLDVGGADHPVAGPGMGQPSEIPISFKFNPHINTSLSDEAVKHNLRVLINNSILSPLKQHNETKQFLLNYISENPQQNREQIKNIFAQDKNLRSHLNGEMNQDLRLIVTDNVIINRVNDVDISQISPNLIAVSKGNSFIPPMVFVNNELVSKIVIEPDGIKTNGIDSVKFAKALKVRGINSSDLKNSTVTITAHGNTFDPEKVVQKINQGKLDNFNQKAKISSNGQTEVNFIFSYDAEPFNLLNYNQSEDNANAAGLGLAEISKALSKLGVSQQNYFGHSLGAVPLVSSISHGASIDRAVLYQPALPLNYIDSNKKGVFNYYPAIKKSSTKIYYTASETDQTLQVIEPLGNTNLSSTLGFNGNKKSSDIPKNFIYLPKISSRVIGHNKYNENGKKVDIQKSKVLWEEVLYLLKTGSEK